MQFVKAANTFLDFFLPRFCLSCNSKLPVQQKVICNDCLSSIQRADTSRLQLEYNKKFATDKVINGFTAAFVFETEGSLQDLLHELKYRNRFRVGNFLGKLLAKEISKRAMEWNVDFVIPMPIHKLRRADRGYNQTDHIVASFGKQLSIPVERKIAKRVKFTQSQTKLNLIERKDNMKGAFKISKGSKIKDKSILILDDVITTGATVAELARVLREKGATKIYACSVAIAD